MAEIWKWIPGFKGHYKASTRGRIKSVERKVKTRRGVIRTVLKKMIKLTPSANGIVRISLWKHSRQSVHQVHALILKTFVGPCPPGQECRHLDGNSSNNDLSNLCWGTHKENEGDKRRHGTTNQGERNGSCRFSDATISELIRLYKTGRYSQVELSVMMGIHRSTICGILKGRSRKTLLDK